MNNQINKKVNEIGRLIAELNIKYGELTTLLKLQEDSK